MIRQYFPRYSGKREVCSESMTKFSPIQIFLYETRLYRGNAILEILYSRLKKKFETAECWSIKSIWFRAELNFCPKIVAGRQECIAKIRGVGTRFVTSLGHQGGRILWEGTKFFKLCPIILNYVLHISPGGRGGRKFCMGGLRLPLVMGLVGTPFPLQT